MANEQTKPRSTPSLIKRLLGMGQKPEPIVHPADTPEHADLPKIEPGITYRGF